jgi:hypothetical protein
MHRIGSLDQIEASQYFELIEDPLLNMLVPMIIKIGVKIAKPPLVTVSVS